jgi:hypothetical protein
LTFGIFAYYLIKEYKIKCLGLFHKPEAQNSIIYTRMQNFVSK